MDNPRTYTHGKNTRKRDSTIGHPGNEQDPNLVEIEGFWTGGNQEGSAGRATNWTRKRNPQLVGCLLAGIRTQKRFTAVHVACTRSQDRSVRAKANGRIRKRGESNENGQTREYESEMTGKLWKMRVESLVIALVTKVLGVCCSSPASQHTSEPGYIKTH